MANETTDTGIPGVRKVTDAEAAAFNLDNFCVKLLLSEPFFAEMLRNVTKIRDTRITTAGVTVKNADLYLYWNPAFCAGLDPAEVLGLLKHEVYHLVFQHCTSRRMTPHQIHNIAADLAINSLIPEEELPKCGFIPGRPIPTDHIEDLEARARAEKMSEFVKNLPKGKASDWYFAALLESGLMEPGEGGEGGVAGMDDHEGWGDLTDEERQVVAGKVKAAVRNAVKRCDRNGQWGTVSAETRETLRKMVDDSVDWRKVLQNFVGRSQRLNKASTLRRINRKYPYIHPGVQRSHTATVAVYVDMSGSVSDEDLERIYGVLGGLAKHVTFKFFPFDWTVDEANAFEWKKGQKRPPTRFRSGGTSFIAVNEHVKKHRGEWDGIIIATDGEAENPGPSPVKRCWVLVPGTKLIFPTPAGDIVVNMDKEDKKAQAA